MSDKTRLLHRETRAPNGYLPGWIVAVVAIGAGALAAILHRIA